MKRGMLITMLISMLMVVGRPAVASLLEQQQGYDIGDRLGKSDGRKDGRGPNCKLGPVSDEVRRKRVEQYLKTQPGNEDFERGFREAYGTSYDSTFLLTIRLQCPSKPQKAGATAENQDPKNVPPASSASDAGAPISNDAGQKKAD